MKTVKQILQESNFTSGVRGFGAVTGDPALTDQENPHIDRVIQGAQENNSDVQDLVDKHNNTHVMDEPDDNWWPKAGSRGTALTSLGKPGKNKLNEAQDLEPEEVTKARKDYETHTNEIHRLGKSMGDIRNVKIQSQIDDHQKKANEAQRVFRTWDKKQAASKGAYERATGKQVDEDAPANAAGGGQIAGMGTTAAGKPANFAEPGVSPKTQYKKKNEKESPVMGDILRRPMLSTLHENTGMFAGNMTHKVPRHVYTKIVQEKAKGKHWRKYLGEHESTVGIREYANRNPHKPIIIEDEDTGYMCYARYGKSRKRK